MVTGSDILIYGSIPNGWSVTQIDDIMRSIPQNVMKIGQIVLFIPKCWRIFRHKGVHETVSFDTILVLLLMEFMTVSCKPSIKIMAVIPHARLELTLYIRRVFFQTEIETSHHCRTESQATPNTNL